MATEPQHFLMLYEGKAVLCASDETALMDMALRDMALMEMINRGYAEARQLSKWNRVRINFGECPVCHGFCRNWKIT